MPRLMSVAMTADAVIERRKTVTRRRKVQGRKPGEPLDRLAEVEVVSVRREPLALLVTCDPQEAADEMEREGFPGMVPWRFVNRYFIDAQHIYPEDEITRIEWRYLDGAS